MVVEVLVTLAQNQPDNDKHNNCAQTSTAQLLGAVSGDKTSKYVIHDIGFLGKLILIERN